MPSSRMRKLAAPTKIGARTSRLRRAPSAVAASLRDKAYEAIKHRIITCAFKPGEYINELQLSSVLKIGRTPVHQALDRLMMEGLVQVIPRKGVIVKPVSLNEVLQIVEVRLINEPYGARLAAQHAGNPELAAMDEVLLQAKQWAAMRNVELMMLLDREFHLLIAQTAKNDVLVELLRSLHERSLRFWFISLNAPKQYELVQEQHSAILAAIRNRHADQAEAAMRDHIESFRASVSQFL
jgi:GntR family transcriptional regulator, rspAB operon transcriptional repressor